LFKIKKRVQGRENLIREYRLRLFISDGCFLKKQKNKKFKQDDID